MHFASFLSGGFITAIVVNPPERKLAKRTSVQFSKVDNTCYLRAYCHDIYTVPLKVQLIHFLQCNSINLGHLTPNKSWKYKCQMLFMAVQSNDIKECNSARSFGTYMIHTRTYCNKVKTFVRSHMCFHLTSVFLTIFISSGLKPRKFPYLKFSL